MSVTHRCSIARCNYINVRPNYTTVSINYDEIGQLTENDAEEIENIEWTVYNKVKKVTRATGSLRNDLEFFYDANGHRIAKYVKPRTAGGVKDELYWTLYYYVRDAQGNIMATYKRNFSDDDAIGGVTWMDIVTLIETPIYGSSRLGLNDEDRVEGIPLTCSGCGNQLLSHANRSLTPPDYLADSVNFARVLGQRRYEQTNHLGNVLTTVSDRKIQEDGSTDGGTAGIVDYYMPDVKTAQGYYPYGMILPNFATGNGGDYRYGYQGSEKDKEIANVEGAHITTFFREGDTRLGRWWGIDPVPNSSMTPYSLMENNPILYNDVLGDSIPATFTDKSGNKLNSIPSNVQKQWNQEYGVKVAYNAKTEMLYYAGEVETDLQVSESAKSIFVNALKDTKTGKQAIKAYGVTHFGYNLQAPNGAPGGISGGAAGKTFSLFEKGRPFHYREAYIDLDDFDFKNGGKSFYYKYQNVNPRTFNFARVFEHEWMGHLVGRRGDGGVFMNTSRKTGPTVKLVNSFRVEMGLQVRLNYGMSYGHQIIFGNSSNELKSAIKLLREDKGQDLNILTPTWYKNK